ncbi:hypothetical protein [Nocardia sp. NPDC057440]|uniref:hypothetical protein n=1 Tax=Nocardia sp. NPDC057440 TaxID=3346134 RepID=UPI0036711000
MAVQVRQLFVDLTRRIRIAQARAALAVKRRFRADAERIRAAAEAFYRADARYATRVMGPEDIPTQTHLRVRDFDGNIWAFTPNHVRSRLLRTHDRRPIGVQYPSQFRDAVFGRLWSRARYRRTDSEYRVHDENAGFFKKSFGRGRLVQAPWARPVYVDAHANPSEFVVRIETGRFTSRVLDLDGGQFAYVNEGNRHFNRALSANRETRSLVLLACSPDGELRGMDNAAKRFADYLHVVRVDKDVFGATGDTDTRHWPLPAFLRTSEIGVSLPGGADSTQPAWMRHTAAGDVLPIWTRNPAD